MPHKQSDDVNLVHPTVLYHYCHNNAFTKSSLSHINLIRNASNPTSSRILVHLLTRQSPSDRAD